MIKPIIITSLFLFFANQTSGQKYKELEISFLLSDTNHTVFDFDKNWATQDYNRKVVKCFLLKEDGYFVARIIKIKPEFSADYYSNAKYSIFSVDSQNKISKVVDTSFSNINDSVYFSGNYACYKWGNKDGSRYSEGLILISSRDKYKIISLGEVKIEKVTMEKDLVKISFRKRKYYLDPLFFLSRNFSIWNNYLDSELIEYVEPLVIQ